MKEKLSKAEEEKNKNMEKLLTASTELMELKNKTETLLITNIELMELKKKLSTATIDLMELKMTITTIEV